MTASPFDPNLDPSAFDDIPSVGWEGESMPPQVIGDPDEELDRDEETPLPSGERSGWSEVG